MKKLFKLFITLFSIVLLIISYTGCSGKSSVVSKESYYMDTICNISIYDMKNMSEKNAKSVIDDTFKLCSEYEGLISITNEKSDIYKINHAGGQPVKCDPRTIEVIRMGIEDGKLSNGRFDITIGKVTDLWDFHSENPVIPKNEDIKAALSAVDYKQISIEGDTVTMNNPKGEINLGGIGKGYIADRAAEYLKEHGVTNAIINFGGNIIAIGDKMGSPFKIGVEMPYSDRNDIVGYVETEDATLVTSGIYERYFEVDDKKYHHIIDVNTGYPVESDVLSVTIVAPFGYSGISDGLSTICLISGSKEGIKLIESIDNVEALFQTKDGKLIKTSGLKNFTEQK